jgi:hypothetical protein
VTLDEAREAWLDKSHLKAYEEATVKVVKIRLDNVFAGQLEGLCDSLDLTLTQYCELAVYEQTVLLKEKLSALQERYKKELPKDSSTEESL